MKITKKLSELDTENLKWNISVAMFKSPFYFANGNKRKKPNLENNNFSHYFWCRNYGLSDEDTSKFLDEYIEEEYFKKKFIPRVEEQMEEFIAEKTK